nr:oil body-associated protein 1A-like [Tanacetum cinerariifolium]
PQRRPKEPQMSDKACHNMDALPVTNKTAGEPESLMNKTLETGAAAVQRDAVETNHYCAHLNDDVRQCILYDSPVQPARIIGIGMFSAVDTCPNDLLAKFPTRVHD